MPGDIVRSGFVVDSLVFPLELALDNIDLPV